MARDSQLDYLAEVPLFAAFSKRDLQKIVRSSDVIEVEAGRVIVEQGATGHECFVILDGTAAVKRSGRRVATLEPGSQFGELALLDGGPRTATVTALTDMSLLVLGQREFAAILDEVPGLAQKILASLAQRLRELDRKIYG